MESPEKADLCADLFQRQNAGIEPIVEVGSEISDFICEIDQLGLERGAQIKEIIGEFRMVAGGVIAGVFDNALPNAQGEIQSAPGWIALFKPGDDAQGMQVVVEVEAIGLEGTI